VQLENCKNTISLWAVIYGAQAVEQSDLGGHLAKKYYVVWNGRETGIFTSWEECKSQVDHFSGAKFKSFPTQEEAETAFNKNINKAVIKSTFVQKPRNKPKAEKKPALTNEQIFEMSFDMKIFSDGACDPNPGKAGSGIAIYKHNKVFELWYGIYEPFGTNNSAELQALYQSLLVAQSELKNNMSVAIYSDSEYSIQCITKWAINWERKGWVKSGGKIKNLKLIKNMFALYESIKSSVNIYHVNGHVGIEGNELADRMSILAITRQESSFSLYREDIDIETILALRKG
jgi:ribonuclease HI